MHFLNPNYHVILIHYPLGVFMLGLTIEVFSFLWRDSSVRTAARWMILLGGLATLPAATSGIYALSDAVNGTHWTARGEHMLRMHTWLQSIATLLATLAAVFALAASDSWRRRFHLVALGIFAACGGLMVVGSWYGGESVYTQGVSVREEAESPDTKPAKVPERNLEETITFYLGEPVQMHMIGAGVMFALAMASLGLSIRKITAEYPDSIHFPPVPETSSAEASEPPLMGVHMGGESPQPQFAPPGDLPEEQFVPAGRFWLIAALLAVCTAAGGYWIWADQSSEWAFHRFWNEVMVTKGRLNYDRSAVHVWVGVSLIVLPLVLAALARWAPRQKSVLAVFASLLVLAIAFQVFLGVLLQFDGGSGPIYRWSNPTEKKDKDSASAMPAQSGSTLSRSSV